jgi:DNA-binding MarR family transcriptional regulator
MVNDISNDMPMPHPNHDPNSVFHHQGDESHLLREIVRTHHALVGGFTRKVGMPAQRFHLMRLLLSSDQGMGVMDLARQMEINASAITRQVQEMEWEGLVRRTAVPGDGRRHRVELTPMGLGVFAGVHERGHELERSFSAFISPEDIATTVAVLSKLRAVFEGLQQ